MAHQVEAYPFLLTISDLEYFYCPLDGMLVHRKVTPSIKFAGTYFLHLGGEGHCEGKMSCPSHYAISPARARTRTARCGHCASLDRHISGVILFCSVKIVMHCFISLHTKFSLKLVINSAFHLDPSALIVNRRCNGASVRSTVVAII